MKIIINCIYRFINVDGEVIYIGRAKDLKSRLSGHNHLPKKCYDETVYIEYCEFETEGEVDIAERYYIPKYKPKYNTEFKNRSITFDLPELDNREWNLYIDKTNKEYEIFIKMYDKIKCLIPEKNIKYSKKDLEETKIICNETNETFRNIKEIMETYPTISKGRLERHLKGKVGEVLEGYFDVKRLTFKYIENN